MSLYLRGGPQTVACNRRRWPLVERVLRRSGAEDFCESLRQAGLYEEAFLLADPDVQRWAMKVAHRAITPLSDHYPALWRLRLGASAPPAVWVEGDVEGADYLGVVGSRQIGASLQRYAEEVGAASVLGGSWLVSGGAIGCDQAAVRGTVGNGGRYLEILPFGIERSESGPLPGGCRISLAAPEEGFSTALAMERNALIYAAAEATAVVHARLRSGGSWHGACHAIRHRLGRVVVRNDPSDLALRCLVGLGAVSLSEPAAFPRLARSLRERTECGLQPGLFSTTSASARAIG